MPPMYKPSRAAKLAAAARATKRARETLLASRRASAAPLRTGGFYGPSVRRRTGELKTIDVDPNGISVTSTPNVVLLNGVAAGTDFTDRIGRKIVMKSLYLRAALYPADTVTADSVNRLLIVYDAQTNGAAPIITDVLKSSSPVAQLNLNNRDRFKILWDKCISCGGQQNTATQALSNNHNQISIKKFKKLYHEVLFGGTAATVGSIQTGSIYLITVSNVAATDQMTMLYSTRIRFEDA